jgi:hypothetical protein
MHIRYLAPFRTGRAPFFDAQATRAADTAPIATGGEHDFDFQRRSLADRDPSAQAPPDAADGESTDLENARK